MKRKPDDTGREISAEQAREKRERLLGEQNKRAEEALKKELEVDSADAALSAFTLPGD